ncbi:MAG TPA: hypothetical protein VFJ58_23945 [Armatimonadota bacterium]|nr:hypothetical protein [Armatimonadota bacterium]
MLSDVRHVFSHDLAPVAAVIVHQLRIGYLEDVERKEFWVTLDTNDLDQLIATLDRARTKAEKLRATIATSGIHYLPPEDDE